MVTGQSGILCLFKCPMCGFEKYSKPYNIAINGFSCPQCSDGVSYPEKIMLNLLSQLNLEFEKEKIFDLSKTEVKSLSSIKRKRRFYDFYLPDFNIIIETHGRQHYYADGRSDARTLKEEQENDKFKMELALSNGIKKENYIVVDCRHSDLNFIKNSILNSKLNNVCDLTKINWEECERYASKINLIKLACDYWSTIENCGTKDISKLMNISKDTIIKYLKKGKALGWCDYDVNLSRKRAGKKNSGKNNYLAKKIICLETGEVFDTLVAIKENYNFSVGNISSCCTGKRNKAHGFHWMYYDDYLNIQ